MLAQVAQRGGRCPTPGNVQGWVRQPDPFEDVPAYCQGGWTRWPLKVPSTPNYSMILCLQFCGH